MLIWLAFALSFGLAMFAALSRPTWPWKHVDLIYYPLGAVGAALFYIGMQEERELAEKQEIYAIAERSETEALSASPIQSIEDLTDRLNGREPIAFARIFRDTGQVCDRSKIDARCEVFADSVTTLTDLIDAASDISDNPGINELANYCDRFDQYASALAESGALDDSAIEDLNSFHTLALKGDFGDQGGLRFFAELFELRDALKDYGFPELLANESAELRAYIYGKQAARADLTMAMLGAFLPCYAAPEAIRDGTYRDWRLRSQTAIESKQKAQTELETAKKRLSTFSEIDRFQFTYWPYFLIVALSLKFGKAVAAVDLSRLIKKFQKMRLKPGTSLQP